MLQNYHRQICHQALESFFSLRALNIIITANLGQDALRNQFGHPEFHFDDNAFRAGNDYIAAQRQTVLDTLQSGVDADPAWQAFGRLIHAAQDFYAHSNYIQLWADAYPVGELPEPAQIGALDPEILQHPRLQSGKVYLWDWLAFIPGCYYLAYRLLPDDSHTHMNLDHPGRGPLFPYALAAAEKRTQYEFERLRAQMPDEMQARFSDDRQ
jgi:hypothetical protein